MQRILIDARPLADPTCGGIGKVARQWIIKKAQDKNNQYTCFTSGIKPSAIVETFCKQNNFQYYHIKLPNKYLTLKSILNFSLVNSISKKIGNFDLLLLPNIAYLGKMTLPYQILAHDLTFFIEPSWFSVKKRLWHKLIPIKKLYKEAQIIDCVSNQTKKDLYTLLNIPSAKCQVFSPLTWNKEPITTNRPPDWLPKTALRFAIIFGGDNPRKNAKTAVSAISYFNLQNPSQYITPIVLGGKIPTAQYLAYFQAPNFISNKELAWLYQNSTALLYPSWYEGFGLPLHEANLFDLPIIASSTGALTETAPPNTIFCNPTKIHEWITALQIVTKPH